MEIDEFEEKDETTEEYVTCLEQFITLKLHNLWTLEPHYITLFLRLIVPFLSKIICSIFVVLCNKLKCNKVTK